jgi:diaminohydroxyphosphoribosylaminopyrimidine deaminase/5-amino-6-(5-phosphoribosylamino)uracil reductase
MMRLALRLARRGAGRTSPNPMVGAVLVRGGKIVGRGYHRFAGGDHAEIAALKQAGVKARGATLYITLEPCCHQGRTPPCARALIRAGIKEVVAGARDPNPKVAGRGLRQLRRAGVGVRVGLLEAQCHELIEAFTKFITKGLPFVILKLAATLDGKIATAAGDARWISSAQSRDSVHRLRNEVDALLVGSATVRADDPQLTCRIAGGRNPCRVVLASGLRLPLSAQIFHQADPENTIVATGVNAPKRQVRAIEALGARVWRLALSRGRIAWRPLLRKMAGLGIVTVIIEGGAAVAASALRAKAVDKIVFFYAPKILGGDGRAMIAPLGLRRVSQAISLKRMDVGLTGGDVVVVGYL